MADIKPLNALHYAPAAAGPLQALVAPPYDVISPQQRAELAARSPYNVVAIDLPEGNSDRYERAKSIFASWQEQGAVVQDAEPAIWALEQEYVGPDERTRRRRGFLARVRVEQYGPGRIRPHERTHPGPKEDRLRLTRATQANLSPVFSLYDDPQGAVGNALARLDKQRPVGEAIDDDGTLNRLWRIADSKTIGTVAETLAVRLDAGQDIALLCEGDPFFYGSSTHLFERLSPAHRCEIVPGVTAMSGCWSKAHLAMVQGDIHTEAVVDPVHRGRQPLLTCQPLRQGLGVADPPGPGRSSRAGPAVAPPGARPAAAVALAALAQQAQRLAQEGQRLAAEARLPARIVHFGNLGPASDFDDALVSFVMDGTCYPIACGHSGRPPVLRWVRAIEALAI